MGTAMAVAIAAAMAVVPRALNPKGPVPAYQGALGLCPRMLVRVDGGESVTRASAWGGDALDDHVRASARLSPDDNQYTPLRGTAMANSPA